MRLIFFIRTNNEGEIKRGDFRDLIARLRKEGDEIDVYDAATATHFRAAEDGRLVKIAAARLVKLNAVTLFLSRLRALRAFSVKKRGCYDIAQFCYIREEYLIVAGSILKIAGISIITVFGADIGSRNIIKKLFRRLIHEADIITVTGTNGMDLLKRYFRWDDIEDHVIQLPLPSVILKEISETLITGGEAKERLGFGKDNYVVTCGSVLSPNEQYELWVPSLKSFTLHGRKTLFVFPFSYGNQTLLEEYKVLIEKSLPEKNFRIVTGWLSNSDTAMLRKATDVLISLRKSDQFAGIILESLYAEARVVTGGWLGYKYLEDNDIWHYRANDFESLPDLFARVAADINDEAITKKLRRNSEIIARDFSYNTVINGWDSFYKRLREHSDEDDK